MRAGSLLISAAGSGHGKSIVTMGLLQALKERGIGVRSFKCGPDYIDPGFHTRVIGISCRNLDSYLMGTEEVLEEVSDAGRAGLLCIAEGAMGLYDGLGGTASHSAYSIATLCGMPVLAVLDAGSKEPCGLQLSRLLEGDTEQIIRGILVNRCEDGRLPGILSEVREMLLQSGRCAVVCGSLPSMEEAEFPSRHLGLVSAFEAVHFAGRVHAVSKALQERGCVDAVLFLMYKYQFPGGFDCRTGECSESNRLFIVGQEKSESIQPFHAGQEKSESIQPFHVGQKKRICSGSDHKMDPNDDKIDPKDDRVDLKDEAWENREKRCCIAVARDEAFSFFYQRSLENLERAGAQLCFFSPLRDPALPEAACGLYLPGGYPELHAAALEKNASMRASVREAVRNGLPTVAECGGFLYLGEELCDSGGHPYKMAGVFPGRASRQEKLVRFGYLELLPEDDSLLFPKGETVPAHEFHYWDSTCCGTDLIARKRSKNKTWRCGYATPGLYAAFPHLYLDQKKAERFVRACTNLS